MRDWSTKADNTTTVSSEEFNDLTLELENTCLSTGEKLFTGSQADSDTNTHQLTATILKLSSAGYFLRDTGTTNHVKLESPNGFKFNAGLIDNQIFKFISSSNNTANTFISAYGSTEVPLRDVANVELTAGAIVVGSIYEVKTSFANGILESFNLLTKSSTGTSGILEYDPTHTYFLNQHVTSQGLIYRSMSNNNVGHTPENQPALWELKRNIYVWTTDLHTHYKVGDMFIVGDKLKMLKISSANSVNPSADTGTGYETLAFDTDLTNYYTKVEADAQFYSRSYIDSNFMPTGVNGSIDTQHLADGSIATVKLTDHAVTEAKLALSAVGTTSLKDGSVTHPKLGLACVEHDNLADFAIEGNNIKSDSLTGNQIQDRSIPNTKLELNTITATEIATNAIESDSINTYAVTGSKIANHAITDIHMADNAITTSSIKNESVTTDKLASGVCDGVFSKAIMSTDRIADNAVTEPKIANNAVTTVKIKDASITAEKLAPGAIGSSINTGIIDNAHIKDRTIEHSKLALNTITSEELAPSSINTVSISDKSITSEKLADGIIASGHISSGSVSTDHIADRSISHTKLIEDTITTKELGFHCVTPENISDQCIATGQIADYSVTDRKIANNAITTVKILDNNITTAKIADKSITLAKLADGVGTGGGTGGGSNIANRSITGDKLALNTITHDNIARNAIGNNQIIAGTIQSTRLGHSSVTTDKIANKSITLAKLADEVIVGGHVSEAQLDFTHILGQLFPPLQKQYGASATIYNHGNIWNNSPHICFVCANILFDESTVQRHVTINVSIRRNNLLADKLFPSTIDFNANFPFAFRLMPNSPESISFTFVVPGYHFVTFNGNTDWKTGTASALSSNRNIYTQER